MAISTRKLIEEEQFKPLNNWILLLKCRHEHVKDDKGKVLILLTDKSLDHTNWLEVVAIGPKCKLFKPEHVGKLVVCPDSHHDLRNMAQILGEGYWLVRETDRTGAMILRPMVRDS